ncbi:MAG: hypothetical protein CL534_11340 [Ahrensia sp.]|nr:hypothetical protein [Ahrensia sp.]
MVLAGRIEELADAYRLRADLQKAEAALRTALDKGADYNQLIAAAEAWADQYDTKDMPLEYRKRLHTWLNEKRWLEDPAVAIVNRYAKATSKRAIKPARGTETRPADTLDAVPDTRSGQIELQRALIEKCDVAECDGGTHMEVTFIPTNGGQSFQHSFPLEHENVAEQEAGQRQLSAICTAIGFCGALEDSSELEGFELMAAPDTDRYRAASSG